MLYSVDKDFKFSIKKKKRKKTRTINLLTIKLFVGVLFYFILLFIIYYNFSTLLWKIMKKLANQHMIQVGNLNYLSIL